MFQYSIPYFSFDKTKFHSMGNEDLFDGERGSIRWGTRIYSMGNEDLFDGERGSIRWGTRIYSMGNENLFGGERGSIRWGTRFYSMGNEVVRVYAVTCTETPSSISITGMGFIIDYLEK